MKFQLLALFYGGPDQIIPLQTTLAAAIAFLLIFWNKVRVLLARAWYRLRNGHEAHSADYQAHPDPPAAPHK
jgi:hypothetical protein